PDGRTAVVCNYGDQKPGSSLTVIDVVAAKVLRTIALERATGEGEQREVKQFLRPHGIRFLRDGRTVVVTSEKSKQLVLVDVAAGKVVRTLPAPQATMHMVALSADQHRAFTASIADGSMGMFDLTRVAEPPEPARVLPTGDGSEGICVHPTSGEVWVSNRAADTVAVVDPQTFAVVHTLATAKFPIRVTITPDGSTALVSCAEAGQVQLFDCKKYELLAAIAVAENPADRVLPIGVLVRPDGAFAYVACNGADCIAVIDLQARKVGQRIKTRKGPDGMAWAHYEDAKPK
ncbi:MAG TPA: beta-propeller fold lactonase family protein, partial [Planctomycetota bacterium]|nr:beta-propeller fold lactonase family protein [Planctomycetota bacterium]